MVSLEKLRTELQLGFIVGAQKEFNNLLFHIPSFDIKTLSDFFDLTHDLVGKSLMAETSSINVSTTDFVRIIGIYFRVIEKCEFLVKKTPNEYRIQLQVNFFLNAAKNFLKIWEYEEAMKWLANAFYFCFNPDQNCKMSKELQQAKLHITRLIHFCIALDNINCELKSKKFALLNEYFSKLLLNEEYDRDKIILLFKKYVGYLYELEHTKLFDTFLMKLDSQPPNNVLQAIEGEYKQALGSKGRQKTLDETFYLDASEIGWLSVTEEILTARHNLKTNQIDIPTYRIKIIENLKLLCANIHNSTSEKLHAYCIVAGGSLSSNGFSPFSDADIGVWIEADIQRDYNHLPHVIKLLQLCFNLSGFHSIESQGTNFILQGHGIDQSFSNLCEGKSQLQEKPSGWYLLNTPEKMANWIVGILPYKDNHYFSAARTFLRPNVIYWYKGQSGNEDIANLQQRFRNRLLSLLQDNSKHKGLARVCFEHAHEKYKAARKKSENSFVDLKKEYTAPLITWCLDMALYYLMLNENLELEPDIIKIIDNINFPLSTYLKSVLKNAWYFVYELRIRKQFERGGADTDCGEYVKPKGLVTKDKVRLLLGQKVPELNGDESVQLKYISQFILDPIYKHTIPWLDKIERSKNNFDFLALNIRRSCQSGNEKIVSTYLSDLAAFFIFSLATTDDIYHYYVQIPMIHRSKFLLPLQKELVKLQDVNKSKAVLLKLARFEMEQLDKYLNETKNSFTEEIKALCEFIVKPFETYRMSDYEYINFYKKLSQNIDREEVREFFIDCIIKIQALALIDALKDIPNPNGYRQSERLAYQKLDSNIISITKNQSDSTQRIQVFIEWLDINGQIHKRQLDPDVVDKIIDANGKIRRMYENNCRHNVAYLETAEIQLHFKALPNQPTMDYAIDLLYRRLVGRGTPANILVRFTIFSNFSPNGKITYPVLISQTTGKKTLKQALAKKLDFQFNHKNFTEHVLLSINIKPRDKLSKNCVLCFEDESIVEVVDNEHEFSDPVVRVKDIKGVISNRGFKQVQWCDIFFCLKQARDPLSREALETFFHEKKFYSIMKQWSSDVAKRESSYLILYSNLQERESLTKLPEPIYIQLLLPQGAIGEMLFNLNYLQRYFSDLIKKPNTELPSANWLMRRIHADAGFYYEKGYNSCIDPEKRMVAATASTQESVPSAIAIESNFGAVKFEQIEKREKNTLKQAIEEMDFIGKLNDDFNSIQDAEETPDEYLQASILKIYSNHSHESLSFRRLTIDDNQLTLVLDKSRELKKLDLRFCANLTYRTLDYLQKNHPQLEVLYLSNNSWIKSLSGKWPNLKFLHVSNCLNLSSINITAEKLKEYQDSGCHKLQEKTIKTDNMISAILPEKFTLNESGKPTFQVLAISLSGEIDKQIGIYCKALPLLPKKFDIIYNNRKFSAILEILLNGPSGEYQNIVSSYLHRFSIILLFTPVNHKENLGKNLEKVTQIIKLKAPEITLILIGIDRYLDNDKTISYERIRQIAKRYSLSGYLECYDNEDTQEVFDLAFELSLEKSGFWKRFGISYKALPSFVQRKSIVSTPKIPIKNEIHPKQFNDPVKHSVSSHDLSMMPVARNPPVGFVEDRELVFFNILALSLDEHTYDYVSYFCRDKPHSGFVISPESMSKVLTVNGKKFQVTLWLFSNVEKFMSLEKSYYPRATSMFIFAPLDMARSFYKILNFYQEKTAESNPNASKILIGMNRYQAQSSKDAVSLEAAHKAAKKYEMQAYFEANNQREAENMLQEAVEYVILQQYFAEKRKGASISSPVLNPQPIKKEKRSSTTNEPTTFSSVSKKLAKTSPVKSNETKIELSDPFPEGFHLSKAKEFSTDNGKNITLRIFATGARHELYDCTSYYFKNYHAGNSLGKLELHKFNFNFYCQSYDSRTFMMLPEFFKYCGGVIIFESLSAFNPQALIDKVKILSPGLPIIVLGVRPKISTYTYNVYNKEPISTKEAESICRKLGVNAYFECQDYYHFNDRASVINLKDAFEGAIEVIVRDSHFWESVGESHDLSENANKGKSFLKVDAPSFLLDVKRKNTSWKNDNNSLKEEEDDDHSSSWKKFS